MSRFFDGEKVTKFLIGVFVFGYVLLAYNMAAIQIPNSDPYLTVSRAHAPTISELR